MMDHRTLVLLSEDAFRDPLTVNGQELVTMADTARLYGCRVVPLPPMELVDGDAEAAVEYLPVAPVPMTAIWNGYIPSAAWYVSVYQAACAKGVFLLNSPEQHLLGMEFSRAYPCLQGITPESRMIHAIDELQQIPQQLGFPVFVKGTIKSNKEQGWKACVAENAAELTAITSMLLARERRSRGTVLVRKVAPLRRIAEDPNGFPIGREYRLFVYQQRILASGFYWEAYADPAPLSPEDQQCHAQLVREAFQRLGVPYLTVDVAQLVTGEWIIIEVNDAQFSGLSQISLLELWSRLVEMV